MTTEERSKLAEAWIAYAIRWANNQTFPYWLDADQVAVDGLYDAIETWDQTKAPFRTWLKRRIRDHATKAIRWHRSQKRIPPEKLLPLELFAHRLAAPPVMSPAAQVERTHAILCRLKPRDRLVAISVALDGQTFERIGLANGCVPSAPRRQLARYRPVILAYFKRQSRA